MMLETASPERRLPRLSPERRLPQFVFQTRRGGGSSSFPLAFPSSANKNGLPSSSPARPPMAAISSSLSSNTARIRQRQRPSQPRRMISLCILLAVAAVAVAASHNRNNNNKNKSSSDPLVHWLDQLTIDIPDQSYKKGLIHLRIWQLSCTHFTIERLYSHVEGNDNGNSNSSTITLQTDGVGATCQGHYDASGMTGDVTVQLGGGSGGKKKKVSSSTEDQEEEDVTPDFLWTFSLFNNEPHDAADNNDDTTTYSFPDHIITSDCETQVVVTDLHFDGSWSAKLIDLFRTDITNEINQQISSTTVCPPFIATVDPLVTHYLRDVVDRYIRPYVEVVKTKEEEEDDDGGHDDTSGTATSTTSASAAAGAPIQHRFFDTARQNRTRRRQHSQDHNEDGTAIAAPEDDLIFARDLPVLTRFLTTANAWVQDHLHRGILFDTECDDGWDGGVNGILRRNLPPVLSLASFVPPIPLEFQFGNASVTLLLQNWTVAGPGWHEWQMLQVLSPTDDDEPEPEQQQQLPSFASRLQTSNLTVSVDATITVWTTTPTTTAAEPLLESFTILLNLADMDVAANALLQLDRPSFVRNVMAEDILEAIMGLWSSSSRLSSAAVACLVAPVRNLQLARLAPHVNVSSLALRSATSDDLLEQDLDAVINDIVAGVVIQQYGSLLSQTILGYARGPVQGAVNAFLQEQIDTMQRSDHGNCTHPDDDQPSPRPHRWTDFTTIGPLQQFNALLHDRATLAHVNTYVDCAASAISQIIQNASSVDDLRPSSLVVVDALRFDRFGSLEGLTVLRPINASTLQTSFSMGGQQGYYPHVMVNATIPAVNGEISLAMALTNLTWTTSAKLLYDQTVLRRSSMQELLSLGHCFLAPMYSFDLVDFSGSLGRLELNATMSVDVHNKSYQMQFCSTDFPEIQDYVWTIFDWTIASLHQAVSAMAATTVNKAQQSCVPSSRARSGDANHSPNGNGNEGGDGKLTAHALWVILGTMFILAQPLILLFRRERTAPEEASPEQRQLFEPLLRRHSGARNQDEAVVRHAPASSLMQSFESHAVHYAIPVVVIFSIVLFLASNSSTGAIVDLSLSLSPSQKIALPGVYSFGLIDTAKNMLSAGIYPLFLLVVVFSGIWPYAKLLMMFAAWVTPSDILSVQRREKLLTTLDACSKYSLVDTYVFIVMLVAFRYHLELETAGNSFAFDVFVAPLFGFYGFLLATTLSLILGHVMIYYHRRDALRDTLSSWTSDESVNVFTHRFKLRNGRRCHVSKAFAGLLGASFFAIVALLALGMTRLSFSFDFGGVAGYLLTEKKNHVDYSVLSLWRAIPESVNGGGMAAKLLQASFFFYTIATPFLCLVFLAMLAVCPLTLPGQVQLLSVAEIANSWSALEVFVLSVVAALFEISTFSNFIVGDKCYLINEITAKYTELADPSCFNVTCTVTWEALYLIIGTILLSIWSMTILRLTRTCIVERITIETSIENDEEWSLLAWLAERLSWIVVDDDLPVLGDNHTGGEVLPVIADERIGTQNWVENPSDSDIWEDTTREDPSWKEWKETTNVT